MIDAKPHFVATERWESVPDWALLQRKLFSALEVAADEYLAKYTNEDGTLIFRETWRDGRDGLDDLYEAFYNLPLLYILGGDDRFLTAAHHHWNAVNRQAAALGLVKDEYEIGYDQFHQSEGNQFFYLLCAADPNNPVLVDRARRFADLYLKRPNYDPKYNIIRAVHTGAGGPRVGYFENDRQIWNRFMEPFGLPFYDIGGVTHFDDLGLWHRDALHDAKRERMEAAMNARMGPGDCLANMLVTSLMTNAWMMTGNDIYKDWVETYLQGWWDRAEANGGIIPDNVGLNGEVGANHNGAWFGAAYGWTWPLGYDVIGEIVTVAAINAKFVTGDTDWLDLPGRLFDHVFDMGQLQPHATAISTPRPDPWAVAAAKSSGGKEVFVAPKKYAANGWFGQGPFGMGAPITCWLSGLKQVDRDRLTTLRDAEPQDWATTYLFRAKGDDGHERPWFAFLSGEFEDYPQEIIQQSLDIVAQRRMQVSNDETDMAEASLHHWQNINPVTTEALVQLTLGGAQLRHNGGLLQTTFRYYDTQRNRPGLPLDVAALVSVIEPDFAEVTLVNSSTENQRNLEIFGGFYHEHRISRVIDLATQTDIVMNDSALIIEMKPSTRLALRVYLDRGACTPVHAIKRARLRKRAP